jgi:DNA primase
VSPGGRIKDSDIETVRERTDIVQVISEYVPLKRAGREFRGPCPFHQEKDPSFYVNPAKEVFFCHGCKEGGGVFNFVMRMEGLSFNETVERLASGVSRGNARSPREGQAVQAKPDRRRLLPLQPARDAGCRESTRVHRLTRFRR